MSAKPTKSLPDEIIHYQRAPGILDMLRGPADPPLQQFKSVALWYKDGDSTWVVRQVYRMGDTWKEARMALLEALVKGGSDEH